MKIELEIGDEVLKRLAIAHFAQVLNVTLLPDDVVIETKSKQNYKSEWEKAEFRARVCKTVVTTE